MDSNFGDLGQSLRMSSQAPLDSKSMVNRLSDLTDLGQGNTNPFRYYRGMKVYCHENRKNYEWTDDLNDSQVKLLQNDFVYPTGSEYDGISYQGLAFNFVEIKTVYSERVNFLESEGIGVDFFNGVNSETGNSKIARLNSATQKITKQQDGSVNSEIDFFNRGTDDAISLYQFLPGAKSHAISKIKSTTLVSFLDEFGNLNINTPGGGSSSSDWYIDPYFQRPSNWNTIQNPKEKITYLATMSMIDPTVYTNGQVVPVPSGSLNDPFKTYEEYLLKRIYGAGTGVAGPYSKVNPAYASITLQIINPVHTASDIEVVNTVIHLKNGSPLVYEGDRDYAIDYADLFDNMPIVGGKIKFGMVSMIRGEGSITRKNGFGLVRHKTSEAKTNPQKQHLMQLIGEGNGLYFIEGENASIYHVITKEDGVTQLTNGNSPCLGTTQAPVHPLISVEGVNSGFWSGGFNGTKVFINIKTQIGIHCFNDGCLSSSTDSLMFQVNNQRIGYQKRLYGTGNIMPGITAEEQQIVNHFYNPNNGNGHVYYLPHPDFCVFKGESGPNKQCFRIENISTEPNGFNNAGADSIIQLNNSQFNNPSSYKDMGGGGALNFIKITGQNNDVTLVNAIASPSYFNMVKGDGTNSLIFNFVNSSIYPKNIKKDLVGLTVSTFGTLSSINGSAIMGSLPEYADNAAALADLLPGMLYKDTITKEVKQVV